MSHRTKTEHKRFDEHLYVVDGTEVVARATVDQMGAQLDFLHTWPFKSGRNIAALRDWLTEVLDNAETFTP